MYVCMSIRIYVVTYVHSNVCMYACINVWMDGCKCVWVCEWVSIDGWMDGCKCVWMYGWIDGWIDRCMDQWRLVGGNACLSIARRSWADEKLEWGPIISALTLAALSSGSRKEH